MKTIKLNKKDIHKGHLILINPQYSYHNNEIQLINEQNVLLEKKTATLLQYVLNHIDKYQEIALVSGYRTLEEQTKLYKQSIAKNGEEFTRKYVALPHHSEHQTGLAIDLALASDDIDFIRPSFSNHSLCDKFKEEALQYGFIERYPQEKETITSIAQEPWHFRYVGIPHAAYMSEHHLCLEEYIEFIKEYRICQPLYYTFQNRLFFIFYVPMTKDSITLSLKDKYVYQISGNNIDGFIVTGWNPYV